MDFLNFTPPLLALSSMPPGIATLPGYETRAAFTVNSAAVLWKDTDIVPAIVADTLAYIPWSGDNQLLIFIFVFIIFASVIKIGN